jgi:hypothetical protein
MKGIIVERFNPYMEEWQKLLLNTDYIVSAREHDLGGILIVTRIVMSDGEDVVVKETLKSLYTRIAVADNPKFQPPLDMNAIEREWSQSKKRADNRKPAHD